MLIHAPHHIKPGRVDTLMSQIDVAPTVLGLMNMSYDTDFMGRDILKDSGAAPRAFISTYQKLGYLTDDQLLVLGPRQYAAQYQTTWDPDSPKSVPIDEQLLGDMLAYYQGGNYLYKHRLNRIR